MSSTIITAIQVSRVMHDHDTPAYMGPTRSEPVYVLWEQGYESNVYPKTHSWQASWMGNYGTCMDYILRAAGSCEGGMLRWHKERRTSPESLIRRWRRAFAEPTTLVIDALSVQFGKSMYRVSAERRPLYDEIFARYPQVALRVNEEAEIEVRMRQPGAWDLFAELLTRRSETHLMVWNLLGRRPPQSDLRPDLGVAKVSKPKGDVTKRGKRLPQVFDLAGVEERVAGFPDPNGTTHNYLAVYSDGELDIGWPYSLIGHYAAARVKRIEAAEPGTAEPLITAMREAVKAAPMPPAGMTLVLRRPEAFVDAKAEATWQGLVGMLDHPAYTQPHAAAQALTEVRLPWSAVQARAGREAIRWLYEWCHAGLLCSVEHQAAEQGCLDLPKPTAATPAAAVELAATCG